MINMSIDVKMQIELQKNSMFILLFSLPKPSFSVQTCAYTWEGREECREAWSPG